MAARKQLWHPDEVRQKIQISQLINRLTEHALSAEPIMDASQVNAAKALIAKVLPDLKAVEHTGSDGEPLIPQSDSRQLARAVLAVLGTAALTEDNTDGD